MNSEAMKRGGALAIILALMIGSAWVAWKWQANAYDKELAIQEATHQTLLTHLANAHSALILEE